jgi:hypothetical protein
MKIEIRHDKNAIYDLYNNGKSFNAFIIVLTTKIEFIHHCLPIKDIKFESFYDCMVHVKKNIKILTK